MVSLIRQPLTMIAARPRGFSLVEVALAMGIVTLVVVVVVGMLTDVMRTMRDSEDDTKIPDLIQQTGHIIRRELSRHDWFKDPTQNSGAKWKINGSEYQCEYFFSFNRIPQNDNTPEEDRDPVYYRILARLKPPPLNTQHIPTNALKTLILKVDWPYNEQGEQSLNTRTYTLLLRNEGYKAWDNGGSSP